MEMIIDGVKWVRAEDIEPKNPRGTWFTSNMDNGRGGCVVKTGVSPKGSELAVARFKSVGDAEQFIKDAESLIRQLIVDGGGAVCKPRSVAWQD